MLSLANELKPLAGLRLGTVVHVGAGCGDVLDAYEALHRQRLVLIEGDPDASAELQTQVAGRKDIEILTHAVAPNAGVLNWRCYNLRSLNGPLDAAGLVSSYPRLCLLATAEVQAVAIKDVLAAQALQVGGAHLLTLDLSGQEDALLASVPGELLRRFEWILVRGCGVELGEDWSPAPAAVNRLRDEGFTIIETHGVPEPLWPVTLLRFDAREYEFRVLRQKLAALEGQRNDQAASAQAQVEALLSASATAERAADERAAQIELLTRARDEQARLAESTEKRVTQLEAELAELSARNAMLLEELAKAEAQIDLISDLLLREPAS